MSGKKDGLIAEANRRAVSSDGTMADIRQRIVEDIPVIIGILLI